MINFYDFEGILQKKESWNKMPKVREREKKIGKKKRKRFTVD